MDGHLRGRLAGGLRPPPHRVDAALARRWHERSSLQWVRLAAGAWPHGQHQRW